MGRSNQKTQHQPDDLTCGPVALKTALEILGIRKSLESLISLCRTNSNGTTVVNLIKAANRCGVSVLAVQWATLRHLQSALKTSPGGPRAAIVDYLYKDVQPYNETGHYAAVASFSSRTSRLILFDSASGKKKSYLWTDFLDQWYDYDYRRRYDKKLTKKWHNRLLLILSRDPKNLPQFKTKTVKHHLANPRPSAVTSSPTF